ncbi:MAG: hypothetical protein WDN06_14480 [Asticcacaulis sp.]
MTPFTARCMATTCGTTSRWPKTARDLAEALYGPAVERPALPFAIRRGRAVRQLHRRPRRRQSGPACRRGELRMLTANDVNGGLSRLLAQPFNVLLTWGAGAYDLDLHMTGSAGRRQFRPLPHLLRRRGRPRQGAVGTADQGLHLQLGQRSHPDLGPGQGPGLPHLGCSITATSRRAAPTCRRPPTRVLQIVRGGTGWVSVGNGTTIEGRPCHLYRHADYG